MHAAMASSSAFSPAFGYPESALPAKIKAPNPASNPHNEYTITKILLTFIPAALAAFGFPPRKQQQLRSR
jgi:hypothetical protein